MPDEKTDWQADGTLDPDRLAILADALEEAGADNDDILRHLRGEERVGPEWYICENGHGYIPKHKYDGHCGDEGFVKPANGWIPLRGPHVRGCWCVDLILGKE